MNLYTRKLKKILQSRYLFKLLAIIFLIYSVVLDIYYNFESCYNTESSSLRGIITKYEIDGNKLTLNMRAKEDIIVNYYIGTEKEKEQLKKEIELGATYYIKGEFKEPASSSVDNLFDYNDYLRRKKIYYVVTASSVELVKSNTSLFYFVKNKIQERIDKIDDTGYLSTFILGENSNINVVNKENYQLNGISHLFSVSGMHVNLLIVVIMFILNKVSYNNYYKYTILIIALIFYLFLTSCSPSILRTTIMTVVIILNRLFNLEIKKLDIMLITLIGAIMINSFIIFEVGFQFSYLNSAALMMLGEKINKKKNYLSKSLYTSFICFLISFPICIYNFYQVNFLSIILNIIMIPFVSIIVFPFTFITFIIPIFSGLYSFFIEVLEGINLFASTINLFVVSFSRPSVIVIIIYYLVILLSLINIRYIVIFIIIMFLHKGVIYGNKEFLLTVIDVGQGDSILISYPNNRGNILIDTGGIISYNNEKWQLRNTNYSIAGDKIIPYLKSIGITRLDYLIISHGDFDHMGEAINLVSNFKVEKVILNCGDINGLEKDLMKVLDENEILYYSCVEKLEVAGNELYFLNSGNYDNENDNSNVIYTNFNGYKFLLMGDAGVDVEKKIIENYNLGDIDVLKVGHHGSKTSSDEEFIEEIKPKYSVISVGKNNRYGHPNEGVLENLGDSRIYRTDLDGSVMFKIKNDKLKIETCWP